MDNTDLVFTPAELEFFAEDELIDIVPNLSFSDGLPNGVLKCIGGDWGPIQPNRQTRVPLWLALALHKRRKCRIVAPDWMSVDELKDVLEVERNDSRVFQPMPNNYIEVAKLLLQNSPESFEDKQAQVADLMNRVEAVRMNKIVSGLKTLSGPVTVKLPNLSSYEINTVRRFFAGSLNQFYKLEQVERSVEGEMSSLTLTGTTSQQQTGATTSQASTRQPIRRLRQTPATTTTTTT